MKPYATILLIGALLLTACDSTHQTTSGTDYLSKYPQASELGSSHSSSIDQEVREVAAIEPLLRFPARIGLVRVRNGQITNLPEQEGAAWQETRERMGPEFGSFVPISPLIAELVHSERPSASTRQSPTQSLIRKIRLAAARQHLDAILIYEVYSKSHSRSIATEIANWTIIGAYLVPSKHTKTVGFTNALLLDVRNGYPYGTATATAEAKHVAAFFNRKDKTTRLEERNEIASNLNLIPEVETLFKNLQRELPLNPQ